MAFWKFAYLACYCALWQPSLRLSSFAVFVDTMFTRLSGVQGTTNCLLQNKIFMNSMLLLHKQESVVGHLPKEILWFTWFIDMVQLLWWRLWMLGREDIHLYEEAWRYIPVEFTISMSYLDSTNRRWKSRENLLICYTKNQLRATFVTQPIFLGLLTINTVRKARQTQKMANTCNRNNAQRITLYIRNYTKLHCHILVVLKKAIMKKLK